MAMNGTDSAQRRPDEKGAADGSKPKHVFGGLSPEKRALLKKIIMERALSELKKECVLREAEKRRYLEKKVPPLDIETLRSLPRDKLEVKVRELYEMYVRLCEEQCEWEYRMRQQDFEISQLTIRVNNLRGKFVKPILKKVVRPEARLFDRRKSLQNNGAGENTSSASASDGDWRKQMRILRSSSTTTGLHLAAGGGNHPPTSDQNGATAQ